MPTSKKKNSKSVRPPAKARPNTGSSRRPSEGSDGTLRTNDLMVEQARAANDLAAAMPFNANKKSEYGHDNALSPPAGTVVEPADAALTASTQSEESRTAKTGGSAARGENPTVASLDRVRVDGGGQVLTTNQGVPIADNQSSLKAGLRGPTLLE